MLAGFRFRGGSGGPPWAFGPGFSRGGRAGNRAAGHFFGLSEPPCPLSLTAGGIPTYTPDQKRGSTVDRTVATHTAGKKWGSADDTLEVWGSVPSVSWPAHDVNSFALRPFLFLMTARTPRSLWLGLVVLTVVTSSFAGLLAATSSATPLGSWAPEPASLPATRSPSAYSEPAAPAVEPAGPIPAARAAFDSRVQATARALAASGIPSDRYSLPNIGTPAHTLDGTVMPGPLAASGHNAAPEGVAYYGESQPSTTLLTTTLNASSVEGSLIVNALNTTYLDTDNPDVSGIQLNSILAGVTLQGTTGYDFWTQNALDYIHENSTVAFGEDTWNYSSGTAIVPSDQSTIAAHGSNGSVEAGVYIGFGPYLPAPVPFSLTLYLNSSLTSGSEQELWYNYSLTASGEPYRSGNYDWIEFNSTNPQHPGAVAIAPFEASGTVMSPVYAPYDFEIDFGIAPYNGATMDTFSGNVSATLSYCPSTIATCSPSQIQSVPAAEDFGSQTGETGEGLSFTYEGTTAYATAGPEILQGLWGFQGEAGNAPGATSVTNEIGISGEPDAGASAPYVFVFFNNTGVASGYSWAPDVPTWQLMPGNYSYVLMLADYAEQTGTLTVGTTSTAVSATLLYSSASGVYTPLWALDNAELAGVSTSGTGTIVDQYRLFNNPTSFCAACGGAANGNLSAWFFDYNDYLYPTFPGVLLQGTSAYADLFNPVSFTVYSEGPLGVIPPPLNWFFDLPIEFYHSSHVTLANARAIGTWPTMFETLMVNYTQAAQNPFPQGNVIVWDSTSDLIMSNRFSTEPVPQDGSCGILCTLPLPCFFGCASPDELLLYGGSNNTVWGNTFTDPAGTALATAGAAVYAGLAEAESGDLIYNNNFSVDNPAMLMAYDIYNDSCWASYAGLCRPLITPSYADTWNVSNQSASNVANTVNGFPLRGNILGSNYQYQGGNFWWNWGNSENPYATLPFVNRFDYTQNETNLPPGYPAVESSLRVGGDFVPLRQGYSGE